MHVLSDVFAPVIILYALNHAHRKIILTINGLLYENIYIEEEEEFD